MALYHIHRPQSFSEIIGQEHIVETLQNQVKSGKISHAYLFSGPRGVGKTTVARILAKAINVPKQDGSGEPDNDAQTAKDITASRSIDVIEIDAASHTGVDNVREQIIENAQFRPTQLPYKVFIIDEVHMLSNSAFNALLKTLEEPPAHVVFILATTELGKLPETIISRCQRFQFRRLPHDQLVAHLTDIAKKEGVKVDKDVLDRIARSADGGGRDAVSLLDQLISLGDKHITEDIASIVLPRSKSEDIIRLFSFLLKKDTSACLAALNPLLTSGANIPTVLDELVSFSRLTLTARISGQVDFENLISKKDAEALVAESKSLSPQDLVRLIDILLKRRQGAGSAVIPQLPLELAIIEWCEGNGSGSGTNTIPSVLPPQTSSPTPVKIAATPPRDPSPVMETKTSTPPVAEAIAIPVVVVEEKISTLPTRDITKNEVGAVWPKVLLEVEKMSPSLIFLLNSAPITNVDNATVTIEVPFVFHQKKLLHIPCKKLIETTLTSLLNTSVSFAVHVSAQPRPQDNELQELAAAFGGEVVTS